MKFSLSKKRNELGEFVVKCYRNGKRYPDGDYYTNDYQDAKQTMDALKQTAKPDQDEA